MNRSFFVSVSLLLLTWAAIIGLNGRGQPAVLSTNLERLPYEVAGYRGTDDTFGSAVYQELNADANVYRHYRKGNGQQVDLYIGYYGTAKGGRTPHNPYACLPGSGWGIIDSGEAMLNGEVGVNYVLSQKNGIYQVLFHWYQADGTKVLSSGIAQNIQRFIGRVFHNRNDGAYIQISARTNAKMVDETRFMVQAFAENMLQLLPKYWPEEG